MTNYDDWYEQSREDRHTKLINKGFLKLPFSLQKYFGNHDYIHKDDIR
jgi:hypothetical protein